jgi:hypothetical protein
MFTGFVEEDFKAFAKYKAGSNEYNVERKTVWNKMKVLMNEMVLTSWYYLPSFCPDDVMHCCNCSYQLF